MGPYRGAYEACLSMYVEVYSLYIHVCGSIQYVYPCMWKCTESVYPCMWKCTVCVSMYVEVYSLYIQEYGSVRRLYCVYPHIWKYTESVYRSVQSLRKSMYIRVHWSVYIRILGLPYMELLLSQIYDAIFRSVHHIE